MATRKVGVEWEGRCYPEALLLEYSLIFSCITLQQLCLVTAHNIFKKWLKKVSLVALNITKLYQCVVCDYSHDNAADSYEKARYCNSCGI